MFVHAFNAYLMGVGVPGSVPGQGMTLPVWDAGYAMPILSGTND